MRQVRVIWIGDARRAEFRPAAAWLSGVTELRTFRSPEEAAVTLAAKRWQPEVMLLATARPGQHDADQVQRLRRLAPLASFVALLDRKSVV